MEIQNLSLFLFKVTKIFSIGLLTLVMYYLINIGNSFLDEDKRINLNVKKWKPFLLAIVGLIIVGHLFKKYSILSDTFYTIIFSIILAYLFNPIINYFESKKISRLHGVLILYIIILAIIIILAFLVIPKSSQEIKKLVTDMPVYINKTTAFFDGLYDRYINQIGEMPPLFEAIENIVKENIAMLEGIMKNGLRSFFLGIVGMFSKVVSIVLTPILTLYFLVDKDYFLDKIRKFIPSKHYEEYMGLAKEIDQSLSMFVRGRLIMAAYVGVTTTIVLLVLNVDFALVIGVITGFADIIPYIGPFLGFVPAVFFALASSPIKALVISVLFLLIQWTENNILAPKVIGKTTGLHPMVVLLSIIIGGGMFGVLGMILSVPFVAVSLILYRFFKGKIKSRRLKNRA